MDELDMTSSDAPVEAEPVEVEPSLDPPAEDEPTISPDPTGEGTPTSVGEGAQNP